MTNKEVVGVLRSVDEWESPSRIIDAYAAVAGDAIELLDWLFRLDGDGHMRAPGLLQSWNGEGDFVEFAREEMRRELHTL